MNPRSTPAALAVLAALAAVAVLASVAVVGVGGLAFASPFGSEGATLAERWVSDTGTDIGANHHAVAAGRVGGGANAAGMVYAPVSGAAETDQCRLAALSAADGATRWTHGVPPANCTIHSVADPTVADFDADGTAEVLAASTTTHLVALHPTTGAVEFDEALTAYGYTRPYVADLAGDEASEIAVVDVRGVVSVFEPDGGLAWTRNLSATTYAPPRVADFTGDGTPEFAVGLGTGEVVVLDAGGAAVWNASPFGEPVGWTASGDADGDGDGDPEVYAVAADGVLRAFDAESGETEWETPLFEGDPRVTPPPVAGDVDGDGTVELVAVTLDGRVAVVDPASGRIEATYVRDAPIRTHATLADTDGDGDDEVFVPYGDGRVVALDAGGEP